MREIVITEREEGQRLDRFLGKYLAEASGSFIYRMLRKKNITLNGKKAEGGFKLAAGDVIRIYFAPETLEKLTKHSGGEDAWPYRKLDVLCEDKDLILINKSKGMLTQKAAASDLSLADYLVGYLLREGEITQQDLSLVRPSPCNRLDRNTSGIVICGKTMAGLQGASRMLRERLLHKYYLCLVLGDFREEKYLSGYLFKDAKNNKVRISEQSEAGASFIETFYRPLARGRIDAGTKTYRVTLLEVQLMTGKPHQIRAHLQSISHPILGDPKYGDSQINMYLAKTPGIRSQLLHCGRVVFPKLEGPLKNWSEKEVTADLPDDFRKALACSGITYISRTQNSSYLKHSKDMESI